jgi:hypothetical protein
MGVFTSSDSYPHRSAFNTYCRGHQHNQQGVRGACQQSFFEYVKKGRSLFFDPNKELYLDVVLRDCQGQDRGRVDFVQEGLVAKLHVLNPAAEAATRKRERARKNAKLIVAKEFFEWQYKIPMRAIRIDGTPMPAGVWLVETIDIASSRREHKL